MFASLRRNSMDHHKNRFKKECREQFRDQMKITNFNEGRSSDSGFSDVVEEEHQLPVVVKWDIQKDTGSTPKNVSVAGSWDDFKRKLPLVKSIEEFHTIINLPEGNHELRFQVDGQWTVSAGMDQVDCFSVVSHNSNHQETRGPKRRLSDSFRQFSLGQSKVPSLTKHNLIVVDRGDYEVFNALENDFMKSDSGIGALLKSSASRNSSQLSDMEKVRERILPFAQEMPDPEEYKHCDKPPMLPAQLNRVISNVTAPLPFEPHSQEGSHSVDEPVTQARSFSGDSNNSNSSSRVNHVMIGHMYAQHISDKILVMSATHRCRHKYVTTVYYRPIDDEDDDDWTV